MRQLVYLAGPLGDPFKIGWWKVDENMYTAFQAGMQLNKAGYATLVPHYTAEMPDAYTAISYEDWLDIDLAWLAKADILVRLPGESKGADIEVAYAKEHGIPVKTLEELLHKD